MESKTCSQDIVDRVDRRAGLRAAHDVRLIRDDDQPQSQRRKSTRRGFHSWQNLQFVEPARRMRDPSRQSAVQYAVTVQKRRAPQFDRKMGRSHRNDSQRVAWAFNFGCDTKRCHTTA